MDGVAAVKVCDGAGHLENACVGSRRETEPISDQLQHPIATGVQFTVFLDEARRHLGVAVYFGSFIAFNLYFAHF